MSKLIDYVFFLGLALVVAAAASGSSWKFPGNAGDVGIGLFVIGFAARLIYELAASTARTIAPARTVSSSTPPDMAPPPQRKSVDDSLGL